MFRARFHLSVQVVCSYEWAIGCFHVKDGREREALRCLGLTHYRHFASSFFWEASCTLTSLYSLRMNMEIAASIIFRACHIRMSIIAVLYIRKYRGCFVHCMTNMNLLLGCGSSSTIWQPVFLISVRHTCFSPHDPCSTLSFPINTDFLYCLVLQIVVVSLIFFLPVRWDIPFCYCALLCLYGDIFYLLVYPLFDCLVFD